MSGERDGGARGGGGGGGAERVDRELGRVEVRAGAGSYVVHVGNGVLERLPDIVAECVGDKRIALVSDSNVGPVHGRAVAELLTSSGLDVTELTFPAGEASKTRKSWSILTDEMLDAGLGRDSCVVAVGGGVTTDLAGFVAATYLRGVPVLHVPTSLLAMVDAAVGGKSGVDVRAGKNLVGAFHAPLAVVADTATLTTLPRAERAQGLVEGLKHGAILDADHFDELGRHGARLLEGDPAGSAPLVLRSVSLKAEVVSRDEHEGGFRQILNFGHTVGHAIEAASGYAVPHGTAVALGMLAEAEAGERLGVTASGTREAIERSLARLFDDLGPGGATVAVTGIDVDDALGFLLTDKKRRAGRTRAVLLERVGVTSKGDGWTHELPDDLVSAVVSGAIERARDVTGPAGPRRS